MDSQKGNAEKKQVEVVLMIPGDESAADSAASGKAVRDPKVESFEDFPKDSNASKPKSPGGTGNLSPEITKSSPSPRKPPRPPQTEALLRRRSIAKPKSRFVEQSLPPVPVLVDDRSQPNERVAGSPNSKILGTPKSPMLAGDEEEVEDEEAIFQKQQFSGGVMPKKKWKFRVFIEWAILILAMGCLVTSLTVHQLESFVIWGLEIWKWCLMFTVICCGRLVTYWLITVLVFLIERNFLLRKKVLYFVYGLKNSVRVCIWLGLVLLSWSLMFNNGIRRSRKATDALNYVSRGLASLLVGSVLWLVKTLLVKILASSFHMNAYFDRIQESIFDQYVLQTLSGPPLMQLAENVGGVKSSSQLSFRSTGKGKGKCKEEKELEVIDVGKLHNMRQEKVSAWTLKGLINVIRSSGLSTISNTIENFDEEGAEQMDQEITNEWEAKTAAYRIFKNVAKPGYKYIDQEDLLRFLSKEEVTYVLPLFEGATETGKIKKSALRNWVVKAYHDRKSLAHSLNDTKTAVKQLHKLASALVIIVIIVVTLLLLGFATTKVLVLISSQLLLVVFMFGNTCKIVFEAIIFVFVMHPFDVGDRCVVDGVQMVVEEMNILTTTFLRYDNEKIFYPNSVLLTKPISNFYRSPDMNDTIEFSVDVSTSMESIGALKSKLKAYIESKPNHWHPNHSIVVKDIINVDKMNMALNVRHTMNFQNIVEKNNRRSDLVLELKKTFEELSIRYHLLTQEVQLSYTGSTPLPVVVEQRI
ncbi:mechanosensitive ion channel protein 10-like isoform X1 [Canna indica]|uniref:Mechanosensitive ion channel protein n=1 Tax=Canna indica TaxID=4628 RepID=A0AAQ3QGY4_9LILI|nr:mechanosensitive ion channel protein 10-like isoform X1 [Canna indica]